MKCANTCPFSVVFESFRSFLKFWVRCILKPKFLVLACKTQVFASHLPPQPELILCSPKLHPTGPFLGFRCAIKAATLLSLCPRSYSLDILLFLFGTSLMFHIQF